MGKTKTDHLVLVDMGTVRIKKMDDLSVMVEKKRMVKPKNGQERIDWTFCGYYGTVKSALKATFEHDWLMDEKTRTLEEYMAETKAIKDLIQSYTEYEA